MTVHKKQVAMATALILAGTSAFGSPLGDGAYVGLSYQSATGENIWDGTPFDLDGSVSGGFIGYDYNLGKYFLGAEIEISKGNVTEDDDSGTWEYTDFKDLKLRVGTVVSSVALYGFVGASAYDFYSDGDAVSDTGTIFGVGASCGLENGLFGGIELSNRSFESPDVDEFDSGSVQAVVIRVGFDF
jgi:hypothetical protein